MDISQYRRTILNRVNKKKSELDDETRAPLDLAQSKTQIGDLINTINNNNASAEQKSGAIDALNAVSNFSPVVRTRLPELVNALRGQIDAPDQNLRQRALGTLAVLKDEVAQERLLDEVESSKPEEDKLLPTATAIAMLGRDEKALPAAVLRKVVSKPPNDESLVEAIRHMPSDPESSQALIAVLQDENAPLAARAMIPEMIGDADPKAFLSVAKKMLNESGAEHELAPWLVKGVATVSAPEAAKAVSSTKKVISKLADNAPSSFKSAAQELLDE